MFQNPNEKKARSHQSPLKVVTVGIDKKPVTTMGGFKIQPDLELSECNHENIGAFILPCGNTWTESIHEPALKMAKRCLEVGIPVGAICGATIGLAKAKVLDSRWHTSNDLNYLKMICPEYLGEKYYKVEPAVTDGNLITASGTAPLEFAQQILNVLQLFSPQTLDSWYNLNKSQEASYFYQLMNSIQ